MPEEKELWELFMKFSIEELQLYDSKIICFSSLGLDSVPILQNLGRLIKLIYFIRIHKLTYITFGNGFSIDIEQGFIKKDIDFLKKFFADRSIHNSITNEFKMKNLKSIIETNYNIEFVSGLLNNIISNIASDDSLLKYKTNLLNSQAEIILNNSISKIKELEELKNKYEKTFNILELKEEKTLIKKPLKLWDDRIMELDNSSKWFFWSYIVAVLGLIAVVILVNNIFYEIPDLNVNSLNSLNNFDIESQLSRFIILTPILSALSYLAFFLNRNYRVNKHLLNEYKHRKMSFEIMYYTEDSKYSESMKMGYGEKYWVEYRKTQLDSIFNVPEDGLVKDAISKENSSDNLIDVLSKIPNIVINK